MYKSNWKLARMIGFLYMIGLDIRNFPYIGRVLALWIPRVLSFLRPFEVFLARIFLWNPDRVKVKGIIV